MKGPNTSAKSGLPRRTFLAALGALITLVAGGRRSSKAAHHDCLICQSRAPQHPIG